MDGKHPFKSRGTMKQEDEKRDIFGYPIEVGDLVTYLPPGEGKSSLRFGRVTGFTAKQVRLETYTIQRSVYMNGTKREFRETLRYSTTVRPLGQITIANHNEKLKGFSLPFLINIVYFKKILVLFSEEYKDYPAEWAEMLIKDNNPQFVGL